MPAILGKRGLKQMSEHHYRISAAIPAPSLARIISALTEENIVFTLEVIEGAEPSRLSKKTRYANGIRNKGISAENAVINALKKGPAKAEKLKQDMVNLGFSENSLSPVITKLRRTSRIALLTDGRIALIPQAEPVMPAAADCPT